MSAIPEVPDEDLAEALQDGSLGDQYPPESLVAPDDDRPEPLPDDERPVGPGEREVQVIAEDLPEELA